MDRIVRLGISLLVVAVLFSFALGLLTDPHRAARHQDAAAHAPGHVAEEVMSRLVADVVVMLLTGLFSIGLCVRVYQALTGQGSRHGHGRLAQERLVRVAVRRPAADIPVIPVEGGPAPDPDPVLGLGEEK